MKKTFKILGIILLFTALAFTIVFFSYQTCIEQAKLDNTPYTITVIDTITNSKTVDGYISSGWLEITISNGTKYNIAPSTSPAGKFLLNHKYKMVLHKPNSGLGSALWYLDSIEEVQ